MKAVRLTAEKTVELMDMPFDDGNLKDDEVIGRTVASVISPGTEMNLYNGAYNRKQMQWGRFPMTPGYAAAAEALAVGKGVTDLAPGDLFFCMGPHQSRQRYARKDLLPVPDGLAPECAVYTRLLNVCMGSISTTRIEPSETAMVVGLGVIGLLGAQVLRVKGYRVVGVEPLEQRRHLAAACGIKETLSAVPADDPDFRGKVGLILECSAHEKAVVDAIWCLRKGGDMALVGVPMEQRTNTPAFLAYEAIFRGQGVVRSGSEWQVPRYPDGSGGPSSWGNMAQAMQWLAEGGIRVKDLHAVIPPDQSARAYAELYERKAEKLTFVIDWRGVDA